MKPFLGINITTDKKNQKINGEEFLVAVPSDAMARSLDHSIEEAEKTANEAKLPLPLRVVQGICGAFALVDIFGIARALSGSDSVSLGQAYENAPWLFWLGGICLVVWGVLKLASLRKEKTVFETDESEQVFTHLERSQDAIRSELSVPPDAEEVDIICFFYKEKGEDIKVCEKGMQVTPYLNPVFDAFADPEYLYLANLEGKYAFPLSSLVSIRTVKKHIRVAEWNKDEAFNKGRYKEYKLTSDNYGCIHCKCYHILEFRYGADTWGIYIPSYELPIFEALTGRKAQ